MDVILAAGPLYFRGHGVALRRVVLRHLGDKFVVHDQYVYTERDDHGKTIPTTFGNGSYFPAHSFKTAESDGLREAFQKAHERWVERCNQAAARCFGPDATDRLATASQLEWLSFDAVAPQPV
jgi:hypothetical protein